MNRLLKLLYGIFFVANVACASHTQENADGTYTYNYKVFMQKQNVLFELKYREKQQQAEKAFKRKAHFIQLVQKAIHAEKTRQLKIVLSEQQQINRELARQKEFLDSQLVVAQGKRADLYHQIKELNEHLSQRQDELRHAQSELHNLNKYKTANDARSTNLAAQLLVSKEKNRALEAELARLKIEYEPIIMQKKSPKTS